MSELLRDVISIPEQTGAEDYVLRLTTSVEEDHVQRTLDEYVVTPALTQSFDLALGRVADAIANNMSRAAFLKGSFGSGKSHFMAVLYALLRHHPEARAKEGLGEVVSRHDDVLQQKNILPLTFHLLGAESMEQAIFSSYLGQIQQLHPGTTLPALHESSQLLVDAENLRKRIGDEAFLASLSDDTADDEDDVWGNVIGSSTWTKERYDAARSASPGTEIRQELVTALSNTHFSSYQRQAEWVDLDTGLAAISRHAETLGYDAVVLFLDELVLWLVFGVQDKEFFRREAQKLSKLVEGGNAHRPIPLVSFVARQVDLRKWFAESGASGAQQQALEQAFSHQEGRFGTIELGDDNLPYVAQQRLLRPQDDAAAQVLRDAFEGLSRRPAVWDVLLDGMNTGESHSGSDEEAFRRTYPFSPALISTLRSLASVMQRDRTALKVMQQILVDRRNTLTVDDIIPVGDAFDYVVRGKEVLDPEVAALFRSALAVWENKLQPMILVNNELTLADVEAGNATPGYRTDERLAKTLLLSAVAPNVPALKGLTASRIASLNHGSIKAPLPGREVHVVLGKVRNWAREVPELRVSSEGANPLIQMVLSDVDYETIIQRAKGEENAGRLRQLIKDLVTESLGVDTPQQAGLEPHHEHPVIWRGSSRVIDIVFGNVRDRSWLPEAAFEAREGTWRFVIDFPFDEHGHSISDDRARLDELHARNFTSDTVVWLPHFFNEERMRDARRLVILKYLLDGSGERYAAYADHLSETDRVQAKVILQSQLETLTHTLQRAIEVAYDAGSPSSTQSDVLRDEGHEQVLTSFNPAFTPRLSASGGLKGAFEHVIEQAFSAKWPEHPKFEPSDIEIKRKELSTLVRYIDAALAHPERRIPLENDAQAVRRLAQPLGVGFDAETHFLMGDDRFTKWGPAISRGIGARGATSDEPVTVPELRSWIRDVPAGAGLKQEVADVVILAWAALGQRAWYQLGAPIPAPEPGGVAATMELREQPMPTAEEWESARRLAGAVFGIAGTKHLTPTNVATLAKDVQAKATEFEPAARALVSELEATVHRLDIPVEDAPRMATAQSAAGLTHQLQFLSGVDMIQTLADIHVADPATLARSLTTAKDVTDALQRFNWNTLSSAKRAADGEGPSAEEPAGILNRLRSAVRDDELAQPLESALGKAAGEAVDWLNRQAQKQKPHPRPEATPARTAHGKGRITSDGDLRAVAGQLQAFRDEHDGAEIIVEWRLDQ